MKKTFRVALVMPVVLEVNGNDESGQVEITGVVDVILPDISDIRDSLSQDNLKEIDEQFAKAPENG